MMKMNKRSFISALQSKTNYEEEKCIIINNILEDNFLIGKKNKENIINELQKELEITIEEAETVYDISMTIIKSGIQEKLKHPFASQK